MMRTNELISEVAEENVMHPACTVMETSQSIRGWRLESLTITKSDIRCITGAF